MVKSWNPSFIVTVGDNNYSTTSGSYDLDVGKYYHEYIGNYSGAYGAGSATNRFFPVLGNHDWDLEMVRSTFSFLHCRGTSGTTILRKGTFTFS